MREQPGLIEAESGRVLHIAYSDRPCAWRGRIAMPEENPGESLERGVEKDQ